MLLLTIISLFFKCARYGFGGVASVGGTYTPPCFDPQSLKERSLLKLALAELTAKSTTSCFSLDMLDKIEVVTTAD